MERWYALFTKPRKEHQVSDELAHRGIETYVPTIRVRHWRRGWVKRAFFPRYIFARIDFDAVGVSAVQWTPGLTNVVSFDGRPAWVPDEIVARLKEHLGGLEGEDSIPQFKSGDRVRILNGPFKDFEAVFDRRLSAAGRVQVLLQVLGQASRYEVEASWLAPARALKEPDGA